MAEEPPVGRYRHDLGRHIGGECRGVGLIEYGSCLRGHEDSVGGQVETTGK
jgi:hypothetical protein